jgi:excisionase family DNA binding protein
MRHSAPAAVTMTDAEFKELNRVVADAIARALRTAGFEERKPRAPPRLAYTMREAAHVAAVGRTTLYQAIRSGELRALKKGARTILLDRDLPRWLESLPPSSG